jgi:hypothetical protein
MVNMTIANKDAPAPDSACGPSPGKTDRDHARERIVSLAGNFLRGLLTLGPLAWTALFAIAAVLALCFTTRWPIGTYYWDIVLYPDAAWQIAHGQIPFVDFFAPVGAYGYYVYAVLERLFPHGHMALMTNWTVLVAALPLLLYVALEIDRRSRALALAFTLPLLLMAALPFNAEDIDPGFGVDGYGIYNRHIALLLYIAMGEIMLAKRREMGSIFLAVLLIVLFHLKITGFVIGAALVAQAAIAGRVRIGTLIRAAAIFLVINLAIEWRTGLIPAYLGNILELVALNSNSLLERLRDPFVIYFNILLPILLLAGLLALLRPGNSSASAHRAKWRRIQALAGSLPAWLFSTAALSIVFESQNTGSLQFIFVWPVLIALLAREFKTSVPNTNATTRMAIVVLVCAIVVPVASPYIHRLMRAGPVLITYKALDVPALGRLGQVASKQPAIDRAKLRNTHFAAAHKHYVDLAEKHVYFDRDVYASNEFQLSWMIATNEAVHAIRKLEQNKGVRFKGIIALEFVNPFSFILKREPVRHISIAMSEGRTVPPLNRTRMNAALQADLILEPKCPATPTQSVLKRIFAPVLTQRVKLPLSECWDMYVRPETALRIGKL